MVEKKRLIDVDAFLEHWNKEYRHQYANDMFKVAIANFPTVDAAEVVHAHWEDMWGGKYANPRYICSMCKEKSLYRDERDVLGNWKQVQALTDYCPHCGAKMDGGKSDG